MEPARPVTSKLEDLVLGTCSIKIVVQLVQYYMYIKFKNIKQKNVITDRLKSVSNYLLNLKSVGNF